MERPTQFGPYLLLERISLGGMAEVFKAKEFGVDGFERIVAVKRILPHVAEDEEFIGMFKDEARIAVQLTHSNIAQIYSLGHEDDSFYIALEYVAGKDLRTIFENVRRENEALSPAQACFIVMKVCEGLDYAHNKKDRFGNALNLIHRDVSPPNILVSYEGEVKLIDFGVVKAAGRSSNTKSGILKGKFGYMAPEQVRGQPVDRRGDIFALGACLWEVLTSTRLFQGESDFATLEMVRAGRIRCPREVNPDVPQRLADIVLKALAPEPAERYPSAMEFHDDLQAFMFAEGLFYSRKNLAAWMRQKYRTDIELEKEKAKKQAIDTRRSARAKMGTMVMGAGGAPPPPPPARPKATGGSGVHAPPRRARTDTVQMSPSTPPSLAPPAPPAPPEPSRAERAPTPPPGPGAKPVAAPPARPRGGDLDWDDDELETRLFVASEAADLAAVGAASNERAGDQRSVQPAGGEPSAVAAAKPVATPPAPAPPVAMAAPVVTGRGTPASGQSPVAYAPTPAAVPATPMTTGPGPLYPTRQGVETDVPKPAASRWPLWLLVFLVIVGGGGYAVYAIGGVEPTQGDGANRDTGGLTVEVNPPSAIIKIDGVAADGSGSPRAIEHLAAGQHRLSVVQSGYLPYESTVEVEPGVVGTLSVRLELAQLTLAITSTPPEADVVLAAGTHRVPIGRGAFTYVLNRQPGVTYSLLASAPGHLALTLPLSFDGSNPQNVELKLAPHAEPGAVEAAEAETEPKRSRTPAPKRARPASSSSRPSSAARPAAKPVSEAAAAAELKIGTEPGLPPAAVFIDGKEASSRTPLKVNVTAGSHTIEWRWPDGKRYQRTITVDEGQSTLVKGRQ
ncbi:MAG: PEGA domain-containing protein [Myxococcales bacterium FL481]|nr:MAG: PEGA domain-containing protein [Myxococcales bacterium FL481]